MSPPHSSAQRARACARETEAKPSERTLPVTAGLREPTVPERAAMEAAAGRAAELPARASVGLELVGNGERKTLRVSQTHTDFEGWADLMRQTFGSHSETFINQAVARLSGVAGGHGKTATSSEINGALALMGGIGPANEQEAAIGEQIVAAHLLSMDLTRRANRAETIPQMEAYVNMATKVSRTMAVHVETLARLRTGGKQTHEVIYVDARNSQNVIGGRLGGGGDSLGNIHRPHQPATLSGPQIAPGVPMWSEDTGRDALSVPSAAGQAPLSPPRRSKPGRSQGQAERPLQDGRKSVV